MTGTNKLPNLLLSPGDERHGFVVEEITPLPELRCVAYRMTHRKSGARTLHLHADDPENLLALAFRTPPPDHTGLPHILEHTALCGSRKYPVKDPFVELLKTSLATFLNAMTYPDKTVYPCASMVERDFFNLAGVYCDAVFHPRLTEAHFKQEGHHFDFEEPGNTESPLIIKGIVYNEMKGAYSDLDGILHRDMSAGICPDNAYGYDSGGNPDYIPTLTYEQFVRFHQTYYHPMNALIFLYGNIPTEAHLEFLDRTCLGEFERIEIDTGIASQPRWSAPRRAAYPYPIGPEDDPQNKSAVVMTFLTNDVTDATKSLSMNILDYYLLGNAASPLRKALIDSKLGQELTSSGYLDWQRDTLFTVGLKGTEPERTDAIVELVQSVCAKLADEGLAKEKIEAAFHRLELSSSEIGGMYPLRLMDRAYNSWLYDSDPLYHLRLKEHLAELRGRYEAEEGFFEKQLRELIVENPHHTVYTYSPDKDYMAKKEDASRKKMVSVKAGMGEEDLSRIAAEAAELDQVQSQPNSPEALATLPKLALSDIPPEPFELDTTRHEAGGAPLLYTDIFSNGLSYLNLAFDLSGIDEELIDFLPLYTEAFRKMGAGNDDYVRMAEREAASTGGVGAGVYASGRVDDANHVQPFLTISSRALDAKLPEMLEILSDKILRGDLTDLERLKDVVLQGRVGRRSSIVPSGSHFASLYAARNLSRNCCIEERLGGVTQIQLFDKLADHFDSMRDEVVEKLARIRELFQARGRLIASFVGAEPQFAALKEYLSGFIGSLRDESPPTETSEFAQAAGARDGLATPADVAFVARAFPAAGRDHPDAPVLLLLGTNLSYGYLWDRIRVKGGAYGAHAGYNALNGTFTYSSYRDPFIKETLDAYRGVAEYIENRMDLSAEGVGQAIIGTVKTLDRPIRPGQAVGTALGRHLNGDTPEARKRFRARLLEITGADLRRVSHEILGPALQSSPICVLSSREKLTAANESLKGEALQIMDL